jgi:hypothetical protein
MQCLSGKDHSCMHHVLKVCTIFKLQCWINWNFRWKFKEKFDTFTISKLSPFIETLLCIIPLRDTSKWYRAIVTFFFKWLRLQYRLKRRYLSLSFINRFYGTVFRHYQLFIFLYTTHTRSHQPVLSYVDYRYLLNTNCSTFCDLRWGWTAMNTYTNRCKALEIHL